MKLKRTVLEFCYKDDELGDPLVNEYHILALDLATEDELKMISGLRAGGGTESSRNT